MGPETRQLLTSRIVPMPSQMKPLPETPWTVSPGSKPNLKTLSPGSTPGAPGGRQQTEAATAELKITLAALQNRLRAEEARSVLLLLQGMDASGKDGTAKAVFSAVNPMGVRVASFNVPTEDELARDFLWRIHKEVPPRGHIGIFNRSHYEDVLAVRVRKIAPPAVWKRRYGLIRDFEENLVAGGTTIIKVMLHISPEEQGARLQERIDDPSKRWKFRMGDLDDRNLWPAYMQAYQDAIAETSTAVAPWFIVPSDRKWYRNYAVLSILTATLAQMNPVIPAQPELAGVAVPGPRYKETASSTRSDDVLAIGKAKTSPSKPSDKKRN
jgi:PPK2 family polyphosphate:nucleotide phosphotransferase